MRITNHVLSENIVRQIQQLSSRQARLQTQVATGQRIAQPEDDPSAVARVLGLNGEQRRIDQYLRNADRALAISQVSYANLVQMKRLSDRASELATLGAGANSASAASAYAAELDQMLEQGLQIGNARFGNDSLFAGTAYDQPAFTATRDGSGRVIGITYTGNSERAEIPLSENARIGAGASGETSRALGNFLQGMIALRDALRAGDPAAVRAAQPALIDAEDRLVSALAEHGAVQTRIEANRTEQLDRLSSLERRISAETDADLPATIVKLNQTQTAYQAALQSGASIMRLSLLDYFD